MIETLNGKVTCKAGSLAINLFYRRSSKSPERPLHIAEGDEKSGIRVLNPCEIIPSSAPRLQLIWSKKRNDYPDGSFIKVSIQRSRSGGGAFSHEMTNFFLRVRSTAALQQIGIELPVEHPHTKMTIGYIVGRFDLLDQQAVIAMGLHKTGVSNEMHSYNLDDLADIMTVEVLEKQIAAASVAKTVDVKPKPGGNGEKVMLRVKRTRRLNI